MADLKTTNTSYPATVDSATTIAAGDLVAEIHQNAPNTAIVAIETELGVTPKGAAASLAARLNINMSSDGGVLRGSSFPPSPPLIPHYFYRTDTNLLYIYNISTAAYDVVSTATVLASYVQIATANTITAVHTFNPTVAGPAFVLGANATGQTITGLKSNLACSAFRWKYFFWRPKFWYW